MFLEIGRTETDRDYIKAMFPCFLMYAIFRPVYQWSNVLFEVFTLGDTTTVTIEFFWFTFLFIYSK